MALSDGALSDLNETRKPGLWILLKSVVQVQKDMISLIWTNLVTRPVPHILQSPAPPPPPPPVPLAPRYPNGFSLFSASDFLFLLLKEGIPVVDRSSFSCGLLARRKEEEEEKKKHTPASLLLRPCSLNLPTEILTSTHATLFSSLADYTCLALNKYNRNSLA